MKSLSFTEFRKNASEIIDRVERGESVRVMRHGKAVAQIVPIGGRKNTPAWKKPTTRLVVSGGSLSKAILEERRSSR